jgi:hypothetical protein
VASDVTRTAADEDMHGAQDTGGARGWTLQGEPLGPR